MVKKSPTKVSGKSKSMSEQIMSLANQPLLEKSI